MSISKSIPKEVFTKACHDSIIESSRKHYDPNQSDGAKDMVWVFLNLAGNFMVKALCIMEKYTDRKDTLEVFTEWQQSTIRNWNKLMHEAEGGRE